ncbi:MAG TPA: cytochrome ubiquinol oxidase subunit I [Burkholderiaceae bacterium]|nr:cytochrome ubiquinol oxidase subunit I [Burkholderiaceae bacterium]
MTHTTLWLAQIQFFSAFGFMLLFLVLEFGLAWALLYFRIMAMRAHAPAGWLAAYRFWVRVFALAFGLSFAAGLPVLIQLGSVWPHLLGKVGDVAGPLLAAIILSTFVFKSCFLGPMLFGARRLSDAAHALAVFLVAVGSSLSSFFVVALVSWMHTPSGAVLINGQYVVTHLRQVVFNPALPWYATLFVALSLLMSAFLMLAVSAGQGLRNRAGDTYAPVFRTALLMAVAGAVLHVFALGGTAQLAALYQPAKAAALAAYWETGASPDVLLFGWPDASASVNRFGWVWPGGGASWLPVDGDGNWRGLDQFSGMTPPVALTFWSFRLALLVGVAMGLVALWLAFRMRRKAYDPSLLPARWHTMLKVMLLAGILMVLATMASLQFGLFPYVVHETITLSEVVVSVVSPWMLLATNLLFWAVYAGLLAGFVYLVRYVARYGVIPVTRRRRRA